LENRHVSVDRFLRYWDRLKDSEDMDELEPGFGAYVGVEEDINVDAARLGTVARGSPADKAGLKVGDVVVKAAGQPIRIFRELVVEIRRHKPGEKVEIEVHRGEEVKKFEITLEKKKQEVRS